MVSKIEQTIEELAEYISQCRTKFFSSTEIVVNREEIEEFLQDLRANTPEEIKKYQRVLSNKEAILNDAREKAQKLIDEATAQTNELISEHEIMQQAYAQAHEVVTMATKQAQEILDNAVNQANTLKQEASKYTEDRLAEMESILEGSISQADANYRSLLTTLVQYRDVIHCNREAMTSATVYEESTDTDDISVGEE